MEKHSRGFIARSNREIRIHGKEKRKLLEANRMSMNQDPKSYQSQRNLIATEKVKILFQQQRLCFKNNPPYKGTLIKRRVDLSSYQFNLSILLIPKMQQKFNFN